MYDKWTDFVKNKLVLYIIDCHQHTNFDKLRKAHYGILTLRVRNVFIVQVLGHTTNLKYNLPPWFFTVVGFIKKKTL
jgi:hypothetical protein